MGKKSMKEMVEDEKSQVIPEGAVTIKRIIEQEYQEYVQFKEKHIGLFQTLDQKRKEKEKLLLKIKKQKEDLKMLNILVACQGQLNPLIANNEDPNLERKAIDQLSKQIEKTEVDIKQGQEMKQIVVKRLTDISSGIDKYAKDIDELKKANDSLRHKLHNESIKRQIDKIKIESLQADICKIDVEMKSARDINDKVTEENKTYVNELQCIISKRVELEKSCSEKAAMKIRITEQFTEKIKLVEVEISDYDAKFEEVTKILKEEEAKTTVCTEENDALLQETNAIENAITNKTLELQKSLEDKNARLSKYNILLKNTDNEKLIDLVQSKIKEEADLMCIVKQCEFELDIAEKMKLQYESKIRDLKEECETEIANKSAITKRCEEAACEIAARKEEQLDLERQINERKQALADRKIMSNKLQSKKLEVTAILDDLQKEKLDLELHHRQRCLKALNITADEDIATLTTSCIIKLKEDDKMKIVEEASTLEKEIDSERSQSRGVTAECNLLTDKLSSLESQLTTLQQERKREKELECQLASHASSPVDKDSDLDQWSDCSIEGAIPIEVAVRRYQQRIQRNLKR